MTTMRYRVLRPHDGDRWYNEGDERVAVAADVQHLVGKTLELVGPAPKPKAAKADPPLKNKADAAKSVKAPARKR